MYAQVIGRVECDGAGGEALGGCDETTFDGGLTFNTAANGHGRCLLRLPLVANVRRFLIPRRTFLPLKQHLTGLGASGAIASRQTLCKVL